MENYEIIAPASFDDLQDLIKATHMAGKRMLLKDNLTQTPSLPDPPDYLTDLSHLNHIIDLDQENFTLTVEGGINFRDLQDLLFSKGFFLPLDNYLSGQTCLAYQLMHTPPSAYQGKYGTFRQYITGLEAIMPDGTVINLGGKCIKNVSGYDLMGLLVGSQERLGLISKATLRLLPLPEARQVICTKFDSLSAAITAAAQLLLKGSMPAKLQVLNAPLVSAINGPSFPAKPLLICEFDGFKAALPKVTHFYREIISDYSNDTTVITQPDEISKLWLTITTAISKAAAKHYQNFLFSSRLTDLPGLAADLSRLPEAEGHQLAVMIDPGNSTGLLLPLTVGQSFNCDWVSQAEGIISQSPNCQPFDNKVFADNAVNQVFNKLVAAFERRRDFDLNCQSTQQIG